MIEWKGGPTPPARPPRPRRFLLRWEPKVHGRTQTNIKIEAMSTTTTTPANVLSSSVDRAALTLARDAGLPPVSRIATFRAIDEGWSAVVRRAEGMLGAAPGSLAHVPAPRSILGASLKTRKAEKAREGLALVAVSYLAPGSLLARAAGVRGAGAMTVCPLASLNGCEEPCLGGDDSNGHLAHARGSARKAQLGRTMLLLAAPETYASALRADIVRHARRAAKAGATPFVRLDGTSDLGVAWRHGVAEAYGEAHGVQFYDYTKLPGRAIAPETRGRVVFSATPRTVRAARMVLEAGGTVAAVAPTRDSSEARHIVAGHFPDHATVDGDASEPLTPPGLGTVRSLSLKVSARSWGAHATGPLVFPAR